jgi:phosphate/sulfate permease
MNIIIIIIFMSIIGFILLYIIVRALSAAVFKSYWEEKEVAIKKFLQNTNKEGEKNE